jgi:hypothetical protein
MYVCCKSLDILKNMPQQDVIIVNLGKRERHTKICWFASQFMSIILVVMKVAHFCKLGELCVLLKGFVLWT